jgi:hypothetical protein
MTIFVELTHCANLDKVVIPNAVRDLSVAVWYPLPDSNRHGLAASGF